MKLPRIPLDVCLATIVVVLVSTGMWYVDFLDTLYALTRAHEDWELDEYLSMLVAVLAAGTVLAVSRNAKLHRTLRNLEAAQEALRQAEQEKVRHEKMISMGQLSSGLAHEINNSLQPVIGLSDIIKAQTNDHESLVYRSARIIHDSALHMRSTVQKVMLFARGDVEVLESYPVLDLVEDVMAFTTPLIPAMQFSLLFKDDARRDLASTRIRVNRTSLIQVLTNLFSNAAYAMHNKGIITVTLGIEQITHSTPSRPLKPGMYVSITVADTGSGMDADTLMHAFEPFYTTKPEGEGTGLGLSIAYGILHQWNGIITLESTLDLGTSAILYIPVESKDAA